MIDKRQKLTYELSLGLRNICLLLCLSSPLNIVNEDKWIFNQIIELLLKSEFTFILIFFLTLRREGLRVSIIIGIINEFLLQTLKYDQNQQQRIITGNEFEKIYVAICVVFILIQFSIMYFYPVYYSISTTGKYQVGYTIQQYQDVKFSIFYPTNDKYQQQLDVPYFNDANKFFEKQKLLAKKYPKEFKADYEYPTMLRLTLGTLIKQQKMNVIAIAKLAKLDNKYPFMIYSHALNSHMNLQASLCKDLASKGIIVIVPQHRDEHYLDQLLENPVTLSSFTDSMNQCVINRKNEIQKLISYILDPSKNILCSFPNEEALRETFEAKQQIIMCGHEYGGQTSLITSLEDSRVYTTIVLDPVMNIFESDSQFQNLMNHPQEKPFLILCSENLHKKYPYFNQREQIQNFIKIQKNIKHGILTGEMKDFGHGSFLDTAFYTPQEMAQLTQGVLKVQDVSLHHLLLNKLVEFFLYECQTKNETFKQININDVQLKFEQLCKDTLQLKKNYLYQFKV